MSLYYETFFSDALRRGLPESTGADLAATAFLDGKPDRNGKSKITATERHAAFWFASFLQGLPKEAWTQESLVLALAHYLRQDHFAFPAIVSHVATLAPEAVQRAARYSGLVLRQDSPRWKEVEALADTRSANFGEYVQIFGIFEQAHKARVAKVEQMYLQLANLTPLELLAYTSLYAFEHLIPGILEGTQASGGGNVQEAWNAIEDILAWKHEWCGVCRAESVRHPR